MKFLPCDRIVHQCQLSLIITNLSISQNNLEIFAYSFYVFRTYISSIILYQNKPAGYLFVCSFCLIILFHLASKSFSHYLFKRENTIYLPILFSGIMSCLLIYLNPVGTKNVGLVVDNEKKQKFAAKKDTAWPTKNIRL